MFVCELGKSLVVHKETTKGIYIMASYGSTEAAEAIGTTPRLLRRFLRSNDSWKNATQAGRYEFTEPELKSLEYQFNKWHAGRKTRRTAKLENEELEYLDQDKGITIEQMHELNDNITLRKEVLTRRMNRQRRLNERLAELKLEEQNA